MAPTDEVELVLALLAVFAVVVVVAVVGLSVDGTGATKYNTNVMNKKLRLSLRIGISFIYLMHTWNQLNRIQNVSEYRWKSE